MPSFANSRNRWARGRRYTRLMVEHFRKEYDSPAYMKLLNAGRHFQSLEDEILEWTRKNRILAPTRLSTADPSSYELFRPVDPYVPELAWSCRFGDGVHNLRSALELLAFELCHIDSATPARPNQVYFPAVETEFNWERQARYLDSVPAALLQRIRDVQPWHSDTPQRHVLALLSRLDNMDKHRRTIGLMVLPGKLEPPRFHPVPDAENVEALWQEPWMKLQTNPPLSPTALPVLWHVDPAPMIYFEDRMTFLGHLQPWLFQQTKRIFGYIATGEWPIIEGETAEPLWVDVPH